MVYGRFDFGLSFLEAVGRLKNLKILVINHKDAPPHSEPVNIYLLKMQKDLEILHKRLDDERRIKLKDAKLMSSDKREEEPLPALLDVIPSLESLAIGYEGLKPMKFASRTLSNLCYLCFTYSRELVEGLTCICEQAKDTLKVIEYFSAKEDCEEVGPVFEALRNTLEGVFVISADGQIPRSISQSGFPRLRVLRTSDGEQQCFVGAAFPDWPMLRTVRTLVMDLYHVDQDECLRYPQHLPSLKQMVFCTHRTDTALDNHLVQEFNERGINCHLIPESEANSSNIMVSLRYCNLSVNWLSNLPKLTWE